MTVDPRGLARRAPGVPRRAAAADDRPDGPVRGANLPAAAPIDWQLGLRRRAAGRAIASRPRRPSGRRRSPPTPVPPGPGTVPELGATPLRLEAGAFAGRVVFVQTVGPWTKASREAPPPSRSIGQRAARHLPVVPDAVADRRLRPPGPAQHGARPRRPAAAPGAVAPRPGPAEPGELGLRGAPRARLSRRTGSESSTRCAGPCCRPGIVWLAYLGIEPWIRRHWPTSLISWSRLLVGRRPRSAGRPRRADRPGVRRRHRPLSRSSSSTRADLRCRAACRLPTSTVSGR